MIGLFKDLRLCREDTTSLSNTNSIQPESSHAIDLDSVPPWHGWLDESAYLVLRWSLRNFLKNNPDGTVENVFFTDIRAPSLGKFSIRHQPSCTDGWCLWLLRKLAMTNLRGSHAESSVGFNGPSALVYFMSFFIWRPSNILAFSFSMLIRLNLWWRKANTSPFISSYLLGLVWCVGVEVKLCSAQPQGGPEDYVSRVLIFDLMAILVWHNAGRQLNYRINIENIDTLCAHLEV